MDTTNSVEERRAARATSVANHYPEHPPAPDGWHVIEHGYSPEYGPDYADEPAPAPSRAQRVGNITGWVFAVVAVTVLIVAVVWMGLTTSEYSTATVEDQRAREAVRTPLEQPVPPGDPVAGEVQVEPANRILVPEYALWAPGTLIQTTDHYPQPGESFTAQSCTVAFSFSDVQGRNYAVTAGHCGRDGDLVWPTNATQANDYAHEAGRFIYSGLYTPDADGVDVGIIEITDPDRYMSVVGDPIPTGIGLELPDIQRVCKTGGTTGYTCGPFVDTQRVQIVNTEIDDGRPTYGDIAAVCASFGDSGGPVFTEVNGRAVVVGVVSGTEAGRDEDECWEGMEDPKLMSYSNLAQTLGVIERVVPEPAWVTQTW